MASKYEVVVWAPGFDDAVGGSIVLHLLCHRLNEAGARAALWPASRPLPEGRDGRPGLLAFARYHLLRRYRYPRGPFSSPLAGYGDVEGAIVVYPEIVADNPLHSSKVVRWLLHRPGLHTAVADFRPSDLIFHFMDAFRDDAVAPSAGPLTVTWTIDTYRDEGATQRTGSCYMVRKGADRFVAPPPGATCVDDMSHDERNRVFNATKFFYSYDLYTRHCIHAAMAGCIPIVVPDPALTKEAWNPNPEDRYGVAYGDDDVPWAIETRALLLNGLREKRAAEDVMVANFLSECRRRFAGP